MVAGVVAGGLALVGVMVWGLTRMGGEQLGLSVGGEKLVDGAGWVKENGEIKVTVVEFSCLECPACRQAEAVVDELMNTEGVRFVYRHFPLTSVHRNTWMASRALETAKMLGKGWEMREMLYEKQLDWAEKQDFDDLVFGYAEDLGLERNDFEKVYRSYESERQVKTDNTLASELRLSGTPTFFVEGKQAATGFVLAKVKELLENK